ncbi:MAG TPA: hypothetical protein VJ965_05645 [Anaerolineales bacterium]|nr:hypothetical protein [Anaerolineales bacterium]
MIPEDKLQMPADELETNSPINLTILHAPADVMAHFARAIADEIKTHNQAGEPTRLILPVGPIGHYPLLAQISNQEKISWKNVHVFNMDEYCDWTGRWIPEDHPLSFRGFMKHEFYTLLDPELRIPESQRHFPDPLHLDTVAEAIEALGGIDTCYGGIGYHGHVAFNEPAISHWHEIPEEDFRTAPARIVPLAPDSIVMNSIRNTGGNSNNFPPMGVTLGMKDILAAKRIRMYCAGGRWQQTIVRISIFGDPSVRYPTTLLKDHPDYALIIDQATASPPSVTLKYTKTN